ncbi:MAG: MGMT family protein [Galactobacter sp.]
MISGALSDPESIDEAVYRLLELVPSGSVVSYGSAAAELGLGTARRPASAMTRAPQGLPWWRMVRADGSLPPQLAARAEGEWRREGTPVVGQGPASKAAKAAFLLPDDAWRRALRIRPVHLSPA